MGHERALVADAIAGYYPADRAVSALVTACRNRGCTDPDIPRQMVSAALGVVLNSKVIAR
jgi:hypothetical protein